MIKRLVLILAIGPAIIACQPNASPATSPILTSPVASPAGLESPSGSVEASPSGSVEPSPSGSELASPSPS